MHYAGHNYFNILEEEQRTQFEVLKKDFYGEIAFERKPDKYLYKMNPRPSPPNCLTEEAMLKLTKPQVKFSHNSKSKSN